ncbi:hypothetical protein Agub_g6779, partial [Astrephomene gubernaculifera]
DGMSGCERAAALEALIWCQGIDQPPSLSPGLLLRAAGHGGFTAPPIARYTFADPWPACLLAEVLGVLARRLRCCVGLPPEAVLELAGGLVAGAPGAGVKEALQALWDLAPGPLSARSALALLSAPLPPLCHPPAAAAVEVKALACQAEAGFHGLQAMSACWLGEHINSIAGEYAWKPREVREQQQQQNGEDEEAGNQQQQQSLSSYNSEGNGNAQQYGSSTSSNNNGGYSGANGNANGLPSAVRQAPALSTAAAGAAGAGAGGASTSSCSSASALSRLAVSSVAHNPLLAMTITQLHRALLTGPSVVRVSCAQALAKIAVRSGEPYRIQCYSLLASLLGRAGGSAAAAPSPPAASCCCPSPAALFDPLGVAPVAAPALEVLDAMYAGEVVLERHIGQHGPRARDWPAPALASLRRRHEWLLGVIACAVCAVPRELFLPLGPRSKRLLFPDEKEEAEEEARAAAAAAAASDQQQQQLAPGEYDNQQQQQQYYDEYGQPYQYDYSTAEQYDYGDYYGQEGQRGQEQGGQQLVDQQDRYDFSGSKASAAAAAVELQWGGEQAGGYDNTDATSDASAVADARPGVVLYSFTAELEEEVSVTAGDSVRVLHDLGEWFQVAAPGGQSGLVPASYVQLLDEGGGRERDTAASGAGTGVGDGAGSAGGAGAGAGVGGSGGSSMGRPSGPGVLQPAYSYAESQQSAGTVAGAAGGGGATSEYYTYQYDNAEYDVAGSSAGGGGGGGGGGEYESYYGEYGTSGYGGGDQYGGGAYGSSAYGGGGGMYGGGGGDYGGGSSSAAAAAGTGRGGGKKGGFGGFDDFGSVLAEAKTAAAVA